MQFVYKEDNLSLAALDILQYGFQTFFKFTPVLGSCNQSAHIQRKYLFIFQSLGHIPPHNPLCQTFHHRRLAHTRLAHQHRIVLCFTGKDADNIPDLMISADDRVQLLLPGLFHQFLTIFLQCVVGGFRIVAGHALIASDRGKGLQETLSCNTIFLPDGFDFPVGIFQHRQEKMFHGHIFVPHLLCLVFRAHQHLVQIFAHIDLAALYLYPLLHGFPHTLQKMRRMDLHLLHQF